MHAQSLTGTAGAGDLKMEAIAVKADAVPLGVACGLSPEQTAFFKAETGIDNDDDLKTHILEVQKRAYEIFPYVCISEFTFLRLGIATLPEYKEIIKLGQQRPDGILLDIGCCFGVDARKVVADGFPLKNVVTVDLIKAFSDLGHDLFRTTPETYPISFVPGDAFDPTMLQIMPPSNATPSTERPDLSTLVSLNPLAGHCSVIYASNFFHLFSDEKQLHLAKALAGLLSSQPGSMICGEQCGNVHKGLHRQVVKGHEIHMFQHSCESWIALWDEVFPKGSIRVNATIEPVETTVVFYLRLQWSVVRL